MSYGGAVAGDNPLRAGHDVALELKQRVAGVAGAGLAQRHELLVHFHGGAGAVAVVEPLLCQSLHVGVAAIAGEHLLHQGGYAVAYLLGGDVHAQTELGEVLEERVGPCGTVALLVGGIGGRGYRAGVDRGAAGGVGNHLMVAEERV